jgi:hypothetical protein
VNEELVSLIEKALIANPSWVRTNTSPKILAHHMVRSLQLFESTLIERAAYFLKPTGIEAYPYDNSQASG